MPRVHIEWLATRTQEQREEVAKRITETLVEVANVPPNDVTVVFHEQDPALVIKGGKTWKQILAERAKKDS